MGVGKFMKCNPLDMVPRYKALLLTGGKVHMGSPLITWLEFELATIHMLAAWLAGIVPALDCRR